MPYSIDRYDGTTVTVVEDGTINNTLDIKLIGKNYAGYGEAQNENFVFLLENFANRTPPPRPMTGQLWYDTSTKRLKFFDGVNFKDTSRTEVDDERPVGVNSGDFWYNTRKKQLFVFDGEDYRLVGPQSIDSANGSTTVLSIELNASPGLTPTPVVVTIVNGEPVAIQSVTAFTVDVITPIVDADQYTGVINPARILDFPIRFPKVLEGITLRRDSTDFPEGVSAPGLSQDNSMLWGTASDAQRLNGIPASDYVRRSTTTRFIALARFDDVGFTVGDDPDNDLRVFIADGTVPTIMNQVGSTIEFKTDQGYRTPLRLVNEHILPGEDNLTDIGSISLNFKNIHAKRFIGLAETAQALFVDGITNAGGGFVSGNINNEPNTLVARDSNGVIHASRFNGTAARADALVDGSNEIRAADIVTYADPDFQNGAFPDRAVVFSNVPDGGFTFGSRTLPEYSLSIVGGELHFRSGWGANQRTPLIIRTDNSVVPLVNQSTTLGASNRRFSTVFASVFDGMATTLQVNNGPARVAATTNTPNTIVARDDTSKIIATTFEGTATRLLVDGESFAASVADQPRTVAARNNEGLISGTITRANTLRVGSSGSIYRSADVSKAADTVAVRNNNGDLFAELFRGTATSAQYADLAEKYLTDYEYPVGTVMCVGGVKEVTECQPGDFAIGVVSDNPAYMMNSELVDGTYIALKGRVPVRVIGEVKKGDRLISATNGTATALRWSVTPERDASTVFAVALESNSKTEEKTIEAIVL
jgi:hypothetical protein